MQNQNFVIFNDAVSAMIAAGFSGSSVIDGQNIYTRSEYEQKCNIVHVSINEKDEVTLVVYKEAECEPTTVTVFIDGMVG